MRDEQSDRRLQPSAAGAIISGRGWTRTSGMALLTTSRSADKDTELTDGSTQDQIHGRQHR
jgi:hypothetical protein